MGWGGRRPGSGRKPKNPNGIALVTAAGQAPPRVTSPPTTNEPSPVEEFDAPDALTREERNVWLKQAPHAFRNGTLTRASALAFERYCRLVVLEDAEGKSTGRGGANHRGLLQSINTLELQFNLTPCGKPMARWDTPEPLATPAPALSKLSRFRK